MKKEKDVLPKSKEKTNLSVNKATGKSKKNEGVTDSDPGSSATGRAKPKAGRGLANEGTIVSYEEER